MKTSYQRGVDAEESAVKFLQNHGYVILAQRYKTTYGEIDIIAKNAHDTLCFIEVKARKSNGLSYESVTDRNQKRVEQSALFYLSENPDCALCDMRFDVIAITVDDLGGDVVTHLDNAWQARS